MPLLALIQARTKHSQKELYVDAAKAKKKTLTAWIRDTLDSGAQKDLSPSSND